MSNEKRIDIQIDTQSKIEKAGKVSEFSESKKVCLNPGLLGHIFGSAEYAPTNISGMTLIFVLVICAIVNSMQLWQTIVPIITVILGYMFGKNQK